MKKIIALMLALVCVCSMLASCSKKEPEVGGTPEATDLHLVENGATQYQIVYSSKGAYWERRLALELQDAIETVTGVKIPVVRLTEPLSTATEGRKATEIVVGDLTLVDQHGIELARSNCENGYAMFTGDTEVVFALDSETGAYYALADFVKTYFDVDLLKGEELTYNAEKATLQIPLSSNSARSFFSTAFPFFSEDAADLVIAYQDDDEMQKRMAIRLREQLKKMTDEEIVLYPIYHNRADEIHPSDVGFALIEDASYINGTWNISSTHRAVTVSAGDYNGFISAFRTLEDYEHDWGFMNLSVTEDRNGSYLDTLLLTEKTSVYAYERRGEYRILFHNVLHHNGSGTRPDQKNDVPVVDRNRLQKEMVAIYQPDVLALQEMPPSKRHKAGDDNLITLLGELGYVETVDPRVKNMISRDEGGYGVGGGEIVKNDAGETFYTHYNCVPLLYNINTTRCLESEYFWFPSQEDEHTGTLGAGECASKATTWGVFESIATGERYIVVSGHFRGTPSVQLNQAKEIAAEIAKLVEKYDCPVFLGGDFNGHTSAPFYSYLTEELDYRSMQDSEIAKQFTSRIFTTHGYPRYDEELGIMTDGGRAVTYISKTQTNGDSIDKVFVTNDENASLEIFGVIVDESSLSSSDHLPMLVDFSIQS